MTQQPTLTTGTPVTEAAETGAQGEALGTGLQISGLNKVFTSGRKSVVALKDANLHTEQGSFLALLGPSGCGKSTILRILAGLEPATSGTTRVDGKSPKELRKENKLGIAFQDSALLPWRSVLTNIRLPFEIAGQTVDKDYVNEMISLVGPQGVREGEARTAVRRHAAARVDRTLAHPQARRAAVRRAVRRAR